MRISFADFFAASLKINAKIVKYQSLSLIGAEYSRIQLIWYASTRVVRWYKWVCHM